MTSTTTACISSITSAEATLVSAFDDATSRLDCVGTYRLDEAINRLREASENAKTRLAEAMLAMEEIVRGLLSGIAELAGDIAERLVEDRVGASTSSSSTTATTATEDYYVPRTLATAAALGVLVKQQQQQTAETPLTTTPEVTTKVEELASKVGLSVPVVEKFIDKAMSNPGTPIILPAAFAATTATTTEEEPLAVTIAANGPVAPPEETATNQQQQEELFSSTTESPAPTTTAKKGRKPAASKKGGQ